MIGAVGDIAAAARAARHILYPRILSGPPGPLTLAGLEAGDETIGGKNGADNRR